MKFNQFLWGNYKNSSEGERLIKYFQTLMAQVKGNHKEELEKALAVLDLCKDEKKNIGDLFAAITEIREIIDDNFDVNIKTQEEARELSDHVWFAYDSEDEKEEISEKDMVFSVGDVEGISCALFTVNADYYFPYFFNGQFYLLQKIFDEFGIFLPGLPKKSDMVGRRTYYFELCCSLFEFRKSNNLTGYELAAFLYGFAVNVVGGYKISGAIPKPQRAYFIGGGINNNGDFEYLDKATDETVYRWQGNLESKTGDIIVMYCLSPRSYIHSIWRVAIPGWIDPFFYFYNNIYIGSPILVPHISWQEIKTDKVLAEMPLVRGNMQGINGRLIPKKYYDRIMEILSKKSAPISTYPKLEDIEFSNEKIQNERDVERKLLEPLLKKMGFNEGDWTRQFAVKMGRNDKIIPDYVIYPKGEKGFESAYWVWEAKYSISSNKQLKLDYSQALSYALRLKSKGFCLISIEGIWIATGDMKYENARFENWENMKTRDVFNEVAKMLGK